MSELFRSEALLVRRGARQGSGTCVVTFDSFTDHHTLDRVGFGERFLEAHGIDGVHVMQRDNDWYQHAETGAAMERVREAVAGFGRVVAYGSSMGAYAAIRLGQLAGAGTVLALSPQFSVDPRVAPWERRWKASSARFRPVWERTLPLPTRAQVWVAYDPADLDRRHVALYARWMRLGLIGLPNAGHPVTGFLAQLGLLQEAILAVCGDRFDAEGFRAAALWRARESPQHLVIVAERMPGRQRARRLGLIREAVALAPLDASIVCRLAIELRFARAFEAAEAEHRRALALEPGHPNLLLELSHTLQAAGNLVGALTVMEEVAAQPGAAAAHGPRLEMLRRSMRVPKR